MAGKGKLTKIVSDINQPGISDYIQNKSQKRGPSSPAEDLTPRKKMNADIDPKTTIEAPQNLPPELKLLYDCISARLDVLDKKIDTKNIPECVETIEKIQDKVDGRLNRIEKENMDLKQ